MCNARILVFAGLAALGLFISLPQLDAQKTTVQSSAKIDFKKDIQPIFRENCHRCHGPKKQKARLKLTHPKDAFDPEDPLIVRGHPEKSYLLHRLTDKTHGDIMPLDGQPLSKTQIALITNWIKSGAVWPEEADGDRHWAYIKPVRPDLPKVENKNWVKNSIDHFILARLEAEGLTPSGPAERARLIRRVYLALTGLPPSIEEVDAFVADTSPDAYEKVVDGLLQSKQYGERWASHWLDLARYADSNGYQADQLRELWPYRDWVIKAFNKDMPFDQFVIEQLAGDLLPNATLEQKIATGFHRTTTCNVEAGVHPEANRVNQIFDRVTTTATVFLGTTLECAQCHDHKYDPFTQKEYYQLFAYFNNTPMEVKKTSGVTYDFWGPTLTLPLTPEQQQVQSKFQAELDRINQQMKEVSARQLEDFAAWLDRVSAAIRTNPARWNPMPITKFDTNGGEDVSLLKDGSVLLGGSIPGTAIYTIRFAGPLENVNGFKIETLTDESLPGKGPGRGDEKRPNFVLSEFTAEIDRGDQNVEAIELHGAAADFSQKKWNVSNAIDGNRKTGWGIAPQFHKPHWATFRTIDPVNLSESETLVLKLDQNLGRGRTIGRVRISLLVGDELTAGLANDVKAILKKPAAERAKKEKTRLKKYFINSSPELQKLQGQAQQIRKQMKQLKAPTTLVMVEMEKPRQTHFLNRGNYLDKGEEVTCGTPAALHPLSDKLPANRLGLAKWIASKDNPLLARVTVNRWWAEIFGRGLVTTLEDFGTQAEPPTHPELLDWLAVEFMESGWSVKHVHKLMVMSAAFQQSARLAPKLQEMDPENRLYARGPRFRLPAEIIRDNALAISGLLSLKMHGPPIMPYQPAGLWKSVGRNPPRWVVDKDEDRFRRGVYVFWKRSSPYPSFVNFDAPDRAACTVKRPRTNTPLQALTLLNDPAYAEMAMALAQRMMTESPKDTPQSRATYGFRLCVARTPSEKAVQALVELFHLERKKLENQPQMVQKRVQNLLPRLRNDEVNQVELAAWFSVANVLLNLDETISQ